MDILEQLKAPFPPEAISWRVGATNKDKTKGIALAYIDARDVMRRFDEVCGLDWQCRYSHVTDKGVVCEIGIKIDGEWRWRSNGAGETDVEGEKGAMSDAMKRAAVLWGVGRYLYDLPNTWVELDEYKRLKRTPELPDWAIPKTGGAQEAGRGDAYGSLLGAIEAGDKWAVLSLSLKGEQDYRFAFGRLGSKQKQECRTMEQEAAKMRHSYIQDFEGFTTADDRHGALQYWLELTNETAKKMIWAGLSKQARDFITSLKKEAA